MTYMRCEEWRFDRVSWEAELQEETKRILSGAGR
jgi:hypothetical protein